MHNLPLALKVIPHSYDHYQLHKFTHLSLYVNSKEILLLINENHLQIHCNRDIRMYLFNPFFFFYGSPSFDIHIYLNNFIIQKPEDDFDNDP